MIAHLPSLVIDLTVLEGPGAARWRIPFADILHCRRGRPSLGISPRRWSGRRVMHGSACPARDSLDCEVSKDPSGRHSVGEA